MPTNQLLAQRFFTLSADGISGVSLLAVSAAIGEKGMEFERQGRYVLCITNSTSVAPIHVQPRVVFVDPAGTSTTLVHMDVFVSNPLAYGGSAALGKGLFLAASGENAAFPLTGVAGSALQLWVLTASTTASTVVISGVAAIWRV